MIMLWSSINEISLCVGFILIVIYGLFSLSTPTLELYSKIIVGNSISNSSMSHTRDQRSPVISDHPARRNRPVPTGPEVGARNFSSWGPKINLVYGGGQLEYAPYSREYASYSRPPGVSDLTAHLVNLNINDVYFFCRLWPAMFLFGYSIDTLLSIKMDKLGGSPIEPLPLAVQQVSIFDSWAFSSSMLHTLESISHTREMPMKETSFIASLYSINNGIDLLLIILTIIIMQSFKSFESNLLLLLAFVGQIFMLHSCDLVSFYICLELQNFCFLVLCGLQPRAIQFNIPGFYAAPDGKRPPITLHKGESLSFLKSKPVKQNTNDLTRWSIWIPKKEALLLKDATYKPGIISLTGSRPLAGVEATIKYLLLSAFSSGVLLFWFSILYLKTGITSLVPPLCSAKNPQLINLDTLQEAGLLSIWIPKKEARLLEEAPLVFLENNSLFLEEGMPQMLILIALMFKLGGAPLHLWMIDIYGGVKRQLLMYISTAPKLSFFGFWVSTWHSVWTDFSLLIFVAFSMVIGSFGAYSQPTLRSLFAYSTVNEIGLMLMAIETAGFHSLFQHLTIYIVTMLLLWNNSDKRVFAILAVSLAGLPPLAGFFGKAWIFNSVATGSFAGPYIGILLISLFCTGLSLVYYLRVFRLFFMGAPEKKIHGFSTPNISSFALGVFRKVGFGPLFNNIIIPAGIESNTGVTHNMGIDTRTYGFNSLSSSGGFCAGLFFPSVKLTSFCVIFLIFAPLFYIKPFVL